MWVLAGLLVLGPTIVLAQSSLHVTIEQAYQMARDNFPLIKEKDLITQTRDYTVSNLSKGYLPVLSLNGQSTFQSTVTSFPFSVPLPGLKIPELSRDQHRYYAEASQLLYDGGLIKNGQQIAEAEEMVQQQSLKVELYPLYDRVNQLFFGTLLIREQLKQNAFLKKDIQNGIEKARALLLNGVGLKSSVDELNAQLLQADQAAIELQSREAAFLEMLGFFIHTDLHEDSDLVMPPPVALGNSVSRPELLWYDYQERSLALQRHSLSIQLRPRINVFIQGGYGRPGLNMLSNDFSWYYLTGVRANWNLGSLYTKKTQEHLLDIRKESLDIQKQTFQFNTQLQLKQQHAELLQYQELIQKDEAIMALRRSVKQSAAAQLENGVLSAHDFINQVIAEDQARQNQILHQIEWLQAQYRYIDITGYPSKE